MNVLEAGAPGTGIFTGHQHCVELNQTVARETPISGGGNVGCTKKKTCKAPLAPLLPRQSREVFQKMEVEAVVNYGLSLLAEESKDICSYNM